MNQRYRIRGVTLIELMIVVTIMGALAVVAIPAYRGYAERTHRTEALNAMDIMRTQQENFRLVNNTYTADLAALGFPGGCTERCVYLVSFDVAPDTQTYTARVVPNPAGGTNNVNQTKDTDCSWFTIDALGVRAAENTKCLEGR
jgi:type IV pilus assembly protein PilE